jgi:hypothetical protein
MFYEGLDFRQASVFSFFLLACGWEAKAWGLRHWPPTPASEAPDVAPESASASLNEERRKMARRAQVQDEALRDSQDSLIVERAFRHVVVLAALALPVAYGVAYWYAHREALPEFAVAAQPLMAQVEARAASGAAPADWGKGVRVEPPSSSQGAISASVSAAGEIRLVRTEPLTLIVLKPDPKRLGGDSRLRWRCDGGPQETTQVFCARVQW